MLNIIAIQGRITHELELKTSSNGTSFINFAIAVDRGSGEYKTTDFIDCVAWRKTAEFIANYFGKGKMILLTGRLETSTYTDRDGNNRKAVKINVSNADFAGGKSEDGGIQKTEESVDESPVANIIDDEDLPF